VLPRAAVRPHLLAAAPLLATLLALAPGSSAAATATAAFHATHPAAPTVVLSGQVVPGLASMRDLGAVDPATTIDAALVLQRDQTAINAFQAELYNPKSASYHRWLTPAQFQARFAAPASEVVAARQFGTAHGMILVNATQLGDFVLLHGTAAQAERTFNVAIHSYRDASGRTFYANTSAATAPQGVTAVLGLETFHQLHTAPHATPPQQDCNPLPAPQGCIGLLEPQALWGVYDQPTANTGQGESVGIIGEGQTADVIAALREFETTRGLPFVPVQVYRVVPGDDTAYSDDGGRIEWELDSQAVTGMAPNIDELRLYFGTSLALTQLAISLQTWAADPDGPHQTNASLGICESDPALDPLLGASQHASAAAIQQAVIEGRSFFSSAGDTGSGCAVGPVAVNGVTYGPVPDASYPAADTNAVSVGGTVVYSDGGDPAKRVDEHAWDHGGGGPSHFIAAPSWQTTIPVIAPNQCIPDDGTSPQTPTTCRGTPDVAALSGDGTIVVAHRCDTVASTTGQQPPEPCPANGYRMVDDTNGGSGSNATFNDSFAEGGTSLSSPLWAGMWARVSAAAGAPLGNAAASLYPLAGSNAFYDVTEGGNPLPATPGWDYATGLGAPDVTNIMTAVDHGLAPTHATAPASSDPPVITATPQGSACASVPGDSASSWIGPGNSDQLAIVEGDFALSTDGTQLRSVITVKKFDTSLPQGATDATWNLFWSPGAPLSDGSVNWTGTQLEETLSVDGSTTYTYTDGTMNVSSQGTTFTPVHTDTGSFTKAADGTSGLIEVDVPLTNVGISGAGDVLRSPSGQSAGAVGAPANPVVGVGGAGLITDQAGPGSNWTVGAPSCLTEPAASVPEAPLGLLIPAAGLTAAGSVILMRRRRRGEP
jgi:pseudomonalisin